MIGKERRPPPQSLAVPPVRADTVDAVDDPGDVPLLDPLGIGVDERPPTEPTVVGRGPSRAAIGAVVVLASGLAALWWWPSGAADDVAAPPTTGVPSAVDEGPDGGAGRDDDRSRDGGDDGDDASGAGGGGPATGVTAAVRDLSVVLRGTDTVTVVGLAGDGRTVTVAATGPGVPLVDAESAVVVDRGHIAVAGPDGLTLVDRDLRAVAPAVMVEVGGVVAAGRLGQVWAISRPPAPDPRDPPLRIHLVDLAAGGLVGSVALAPGARVAGATDRGLVVVEADGAAVLSIDAAGRLARRPLSSGFPVVAGADRVGLVECDGRFRCLLTTRDDDGALVRALPFGDERGAVQVLDAAVAPGGDALALVVDDPGGGSDDLELVLVELVARGPVRGLATFDRTAPPDGMAWSPDGAVLVWRQPDEGTNPGRLGVHDRPTGWTGVVDTVGPLDGQVVGVLGPVGGRLVGPATHLR